MKRCDTCATRGSGEAQERWIIAIELPEEIETRLSALAEATGRPASYFVREAILEHLDDLEDVVLAEGELRAVEQGRSQAVPLADVVEQYGLAD